MKERVEKKRKENREGSLNERESRKGKIKE